jgi:hypothetical protein
MNCYDDKRDVSPSRHVREVIISRRTTGNLLGSRRKKTGVLLPVQSRLPSSVLILIEKPRGSLAESDEPDSPPTVEKRTTIGALVPGFASCRERVRRGQAGHALNRQRDGVYRSATEVLKALADRLPLAESAGALGVDDPFRDALAVEGRQGVAEEMGRELTAVSRSERTRVA